MGGTKTRKQSLSAGAYTLALTAALIAAEVVLSRFLSFSVWNMKIGFAFLPVVVAAIVLGPLQAGIVGAVADLLGALLFPIGAYFPGFTLTAFLMGLVFGVFLHKRISFVRTLLAVGVNQLVLSLLLNTLWISILYGSPYTALLVTRLTQCAILLPVQIFSILMIQKVMGEKLLKESLRIRRDAKRIQRMRGRSARRAIEDGDRAEFDAAICRAIIDSEGFSRARTVLLYNRFDGEPDLSAVTEAALQAGKRVAYPACEDAMRFSARIPDGADAMTAGRYGILSPIEAHSELCEPESIDLLLAPCTAFDARGYRIGMGRGYYDRYIRLCPNAVVCLVAYESQRMVRVVTEEHDLPCGYIVTQKGLRKAR